MSTMKIRLYVMLPVFVIVPDPIPNFAMGSGTMAFYAMRPDPLTFFNIILFHEL